MIFAMRCYSIIDIQDKKSIDHIQFLYQNM